ncbi:hypothetical protein M9H77_35649 [Catharanthus roseus]|uniref:Uncharacterized protein n=1 Tax=Catharanthus roseus TaxID=4058 RepID=A0ACB9ZQI4_CATRO|nr:hypothetical protein M9H77_35649 [Catharanthus roseus]
MASISNLPYVEGKKPPFKKRGQSSSLFKARGFECNSTDHLVADCPKAIEKKKGNANVGREENYEEGGSSRGERTGKGKGKRVATEVRLPERFIFIKGAANFEKWTRKRRKIAPGHRVDLSDMEATQTSSTKCFPYGCFLTKVFQYFMLNLVGVGDHIGIGKIYNKRTFKGMGFSRNEEGMLVRGGQDDNDESGEDDEQNEEQEAMNVDEEVKKNQKRRLLEEK